VPTTACLFPGANNAHRPYPASIVRKQAPDLGFQILTSLLEPDNSRESSLDSATVLMSERWPGESKPCRRLTSSSLMCHTCSVDGAIEWMASQNKCSLLDALLECATYQARCMTELDVQLGRVASKWKGNHFNAYKCHLLRCIKCIYNLERVMHTSRELLTSAMVKDTPPFADCDGAIAKDLIFCLHLIVCAHEQNLQSENFLNKSSQQNQQHIQIYTHFSWLLYSHCIANFELLICCQQMSWGSRSIM